MMESVRIVPNLRMVLWFDMLVRSRPPDGPVLQTAFILRTIVTHLCGSKLLRPEPEPQPRLALSLDHPQDPSYA